MEYKLAVNNDDVLLFHTAPHITLHDLIEALEKALLSNLQNQLLKILCS